jgi:signal transduction histidine kinase
MRSLFRALALEDLMRRLSERSLWYLTGLTLLALWMVGVATTHSMSRYAQSMYWVSRTQQVETAIESIRADLHSAQDDCLAYVFAQPGALQKFETAAVALPAQITELRRLTRDSPSQQTLLEGLEPLVNQQIAFFRTSAAMKDKGGSIELLQEFFANSQTWSQQAFAKLQSMRVEEQRLLGQRTLISDKTYAMQKLVLSISFVVVLIFAILNFIELLVQLRERQNAEQVVRRLSGRMLQVQDEERRKIARDLHDGIGQIFAALKMELNQLAKADSRSQGSAILSNSIALADEGLTQSRTISYLLHPPMLDEVGFNAAAKWLVDGFSQRSRIAVALQTPDELKLPRELELTLFRVLQESLTNVHRHSGSARAEVAVVASSHHVIMTIRDHGKGIPEATLQNFRCSKSPAGVGLAGMRGRVADMDGKLEVECPDHGTIVRVIVPLARTSETAQISSTPPSADGPHIPAQKEKRGPVSVEFAGLNPFS